MKLRAAVLTLILLLSTNWPSAGASRFAPVDELKSEAERAFGQALDLWRDGQFAQLYDRTKGGRETREAFARRLIAAPLKPACCWRRCRGFRAAGRRFHRDRQGETGFRRAGRHRVPNRFLPAGEGRRRLASLPQRHLFSRRQQERKIFALIRH